MDKIFKIICIVMFLVGGGVGYLLTAFFYNEHDNFHGLISHFCGAICLITATIMSMYWI